MGRYGSTTVLPQLCVAVVLVCSASAAAAMSCGDAVMAMAPCGGYLVGVGSGNYPPVQCCRSVRSLSRMIGTRPERRDMCLCFKQTGPSFGVRPEKIRSMLLFCNLQIDLPVGPNMDCDRVS